MTEVKGKSGNRRNATLELVGNELRYVVKPGMFRGSGEVHEVPLNEIVSLETKTDIKPYPDAQWVLISHNSGSIEFFSINKNPLRNITKTVAEFLEEKALKLKEDEETFNVIRESNVALIVINLELVDSLIRLVRKLDGRVNWGEVEAELIQTESILVDRANVPNLNPASFSIKSLRNGVERRLVYAIKQEVHDIISILHHEASERGSHLTPWFPSDFHRLFVFSSLTYWSNELGNLTDVAVLDEPDNQKALFDSLHRAVADYTEDSGLEPIIVEEMEPNRVRATLYMWADLLLQVPFSQDKE